tara:strand:+ start:249 stop:1166 length:918 start_codon:yes stop_codon:yes gene_type:complete
MKIIELVLDEDQEGGGIEAISIVESPAIEEDFVALNSQEIKLAEVSKDKKLLMGALLVPNKPIFRKSGEEEYYIYFSKKTIEKASQLYLQNGNQNNSTLEHQHSLSGLTLVESWIVESETNDKSRMYNMDVPIGTWMGTVKVENDKVWNEYVKTNKVKGFSIEGYFADKMERPKDKVLDNYEIEAEQLLSKIESIVKGEKVELNLVDDVVDTYDKLKKEVDNIGTQSINIANDLQKLNDKGMTLLKELNQTDTDVEKLEQGAEDLGIDLPQEAQISVKMLKQLKIDIRKTTKAIEKSSSLLFNSF